MKRAAKYKKIWYAIALSFWFMRYLISSENGIRAWIRGAWFFSEVDASIKLALQYQDKTIDPVCDNLNAYDPQSTKIVTVSEGEAELQGEKWVCNIKAKIRYENWIYWVSHC